MGEDDAVASLRRVEGEAACAGRVGVATRRYRIRAERKYGEPRSTKPPQGSRVITAMRSSTKSTRARRCGRDLKPFCDLEKQGGRLGRQFEHDGKQLGERVSRRCAGFCAGCWRILRFAARILRSFGPPWGYLKRPCHSRLRVARPFRFRCASGRCGSGFRCRSTPTKSPSPGMPRP